MLERLLCTPLLPEGVEIEVYADEPTWMAKRNTAPWRVNASEASALFGQNTFLSAFALAQLKLGIELPPADEELTSKGKRWESFIADEACHELNKNAPEGVVYRRCYIPNYVRITNVKHPALAATPDDILVVSHRRPDSDAYDDVAIIPLECKKVRWNLEYRWQEHAPTGYRIQNQVQMLCCGAKRGVVAAMIGDEVRVFEYPLAKSAQQISLCAEKFLQDLHEGVLPPVDGHNATSEVLAKMFEDPSVETSIPLPPSADEVILAFEQAREERKVWEEREEEAKNKLKAMLGNATAGVFSEGLVTWKQQGGNLTGLIVEPAAEGSLAAAGVHYERKYSAKTRVLRIQRKKTK